MSVDNPISPSLASAAIPVPRVVAANVIVSPQPQRKSALVDDNPRKATAALLLVLVALGVTAWYLPRGWNLIAALVLMTTFILILGKTLTGRSLGVLITDRNVMSLSRFQMLLWTVLIISAYLVIALERVRNADIPEPLLIGIDWHIWALLGISTTSLVGTPLLYGNKKRTEPGDTDEDTQQAVAKAARTLREDPAQVEQNRVGVLYGNNTIEDARFTDLFQGDEIADASFLDVGKLQLFFFTVIVATTYGVQLYQLIANNDLSDDVRLPSLNDGLLALLGVSHAGYLGTKGITQTRT
jgi:cell division protein FtsL